MQRIDPINEQTCREHYGKPVLLFLFDGSEVSGVMSRIEGGKLILNDSDNNNDGDKVVTSRKKAKTKAVTKKAGRRPKKVWTAASAETEFDPEPYGVPPADHGFSGNGYGWGAPLVFELTAIATLFVLI